jgi:hypothetical protein
MSKHAGGRGWGLALLSTLLAVTSAVSAAALPTGVALPAVSVIPNGLGTPPGPVNLAPLDLAAFGYTESEFLISGHARKYVPDGTLASDGHWTVSPSGLPQAYTTRILVRRPTDPSHFNGTVVVEWLNVTSGYDLDVDWPQSYPQFLRAGYAWVGVSAQKIGAEALNRIKPDRYGSISIPSDDLSYDIFSQAAQAIRRRPGLVLGGLQPQILLATGQSQSAIRLTTYTDAIQPIAQVFDGILIHSRSAAAAPISGVTLPPSPAYIRDDLAVPVLQLESQTDVSTLQFFKARQPDTDRLRSWEVAGTSHIDANFLTAANAESAAALGAPPVSCLKQVNSAPFRYVENAAWAALDAWVRNGTPPPHSPQIAVDDQGVVQLDANGNAIGGIRLPELEVPVARYTTVNIGRPNTGVPNGLDWLGCSLFGSTEPFSRKQLGSLYSSHDDYVARYSAAAQALVDAGFMLPEDRALAVLRAQQSNIR